MRKLIFLGAIAFFGTFAFSQSPGGVTAGQVLLPCPSSGSIYCPAAASIQVSANPSTVAVGATTVLQATAFDTTGTQNISVTHQCVWTSSNTAVVTVGDGTATAVGAGSATINCTIGGISAAVPVSVTVVNVTITQPTCGTPPCTLPPGVVGTAYSYTPLASGGSGIYTWAITAGGFSACGVTLNSSTGVLAGASPSASTCTATVAVTDTLSNTATVQVSLTIASTGPTCGPPNYLCTPTLQTQPGAFAPTQYPFSGFYSNCVPGPEPACSGTDNAIVTDPEPVSSGNNSGLYHSPIVRVTNAYTGCGNYTEPACGSTPATWNTFFVDSSAEVQHWNTNSTRFWLIDQSSNNYVFAFNPSTMQATFLYSSHQSCSGSPVTCNGMMWPNGASWSTTLQYIFYGMSTPNPGNANGCTLNKWDTTSTSVFPTPVQIYTFCGNSPNGVPASALYSTDPPSVGVVGGVDTVFIDGFSTSPSQNTARYYAAYKVGSGISVWNSLNNTVTGDWGSNNLPMICQNCVFSPLPISNITVSSSCNAFTHTCPATLTLTSVAGTNSGDIFTIAGNSQSCLNIAGLTATSVNASSLQITASVPVACGGVTGTGGTLTDTTPSPGTFSTHNVKASLKGDYVTVNVETCDPAPNVCYNGSGTPYLWQTGTNNVYTHCPLASGNDCSGHGATAALNYYQQFSIAFISQKAFTAPGTPTKFPSTLPCTANFTEEHLGVQSMLDGLDDGIVTGTSSSNNGAGNYANCLANEISGVFPPASPNSGQWKRFGHTYVVQTGCFGAQQAIGSVSQDGKFYMWPSPMNNALGCMNGSATGCTAVTSCQNTVASPRADVFIQELQ